MQAKSSFLAIAMGVIVGASGLVSGTPGTADEHRSAQLVQVDTINISTDDVHVNIKPAQGEQVDMHLHGTATNVERYHLRTETKGNTLEVAIDRDRTLVLNASSDLQLDIALPPQLYEALRVQTSSGRVNLFDQGARALSVTTETGSVDLEQAESDTLDIATLAGETHLLRVQAGTAARIQTGKGELTIHELTAKTLEASTSEGSIDIADVTGEVRTRSESGGQEIRLDRLEQNIVAASESGEVRLFLPSGSSYNLAYLTNSGTDKVNFPIHYSTKETPSSVKRGVVGQGGPLLDITTRSGDLTIIKN